MADEKNNENENTVQSEAQGTQALVPTAPKGLEQNEEDKLKEESLKLVKQLEENPNDRAIMRTLQNLGANAQIQASDEISLLKTRVGDLMNNLDGENAQIPKNLVQLRVRIDELNPNVEAKGFLGRLFSRGNPILRRLKEVGVKYQSVNAQIDAISNNLRQGKDQLIKDNIQLEKLYEKVQAHQQDIQKKAFQGEVAWRALEGLYSKTADDVERNKIQNLLHAVAMRVQDLRTMEQVNFQFFISIDMTLDNNVKLGQAVDRTVTVTSSLLTVALSIQAALASQKRVLEAVKETQKQTAEMLVQSAAALKRQTAEIADLHRNPVLALDKVKTAFNDVLAAIDESDKVKAEAIVKAREGVTELTSMSAELQKKTEGLKAARLSESGNDV